MELVLQCKKCGGTDLKCSDSGPDLVPQGGDIYSPANGKWELDLSGMLCTTQQALLNRDFTRDLTEREETTIREHYQSWYCEVWHDGAHVITFGLGDSDPQGG